MTGNDQRATDLARDEIRPGEKTVELPERQDAHLLFIGRISTPWKSRDECPRQGKHDGPLCTIEVFEPWQDALRGLEHFQQVEVLYWLDRSRRDLVLQNPARDGTLRGTFALRSPARPNPIGTSMAKLVEIGEGRLVVQGLDCVDGTPLIDLKPNRCEFTPLAVMKPGKGKAE